MRKELIDKGIKDFEEVSNIINNWKGTFKELSSHLSGFNYEEDGPNEYLFDYNYGAVNGTVLCKQGVIKGDTSFDIWDDETSEILTVRQFHNSNGIKGYTYDSAQEPVKTQKYYIQVTETLQRIVAVEATCLEEAYDKIDEWANEDEGLNYEDFVSRDFNDLTKQCAKRGELFPESYFTLPNSKNK